LLAIMADAQASKLSYHFCSVEDIQAEFESERHMRERKIVVVGGWIRNSRLRHAQLYWARAAVLQYLRILVFRGVIERDIASLSMLQPDILSAILGKVGGGGKTNFKSTFSAQLSSSPPSNRAYDQGSGDSKIVAQRRIWDLLASVVEPGKIEYDTLNFVWRNQIPSYEAWWKIIDAEPLQKFWFEQIFGDFYVNDRKFIDARVGNENDIDNSNLCVETSGKFE